MSDTNSAVQPLKKARGLKFLIYKVEGLYFLRSKNKGVDQLICAFVYVYLQKAAFLMTRLILNIEADPDKVKTEPRCEKTGLWGFRPGPTYQAVQPQKMARGLKFRI